MRRQRIFLGDLLTALQVVPLDYFGQRYCIFQEDAIMTQQTTPRLKPAVALATFCVILSIVCNLPQVLSLGSECYTITGVDYRGTQEKIGLPPLTAGEEIIQSPDCLPWNSSVESTKPRARERGIGPHNYCRNPDGDILPWCKVPGIAGSEGAWGYCHLPKCRVPGYLGCFPDNGQPPALDAVNVLHKYTTVGACLLFCRRLGYKYAGLEAGHACYCGNKGYSRYGSSAERGNHCSSKCFGNKGQPCGGDGYVDVYKSDIGSCGSPAPLHDRHGAVYSPGYPDFPTGAGLMTSLSAAESMMIKLRERKRDQTNFNDNELDETKSTPYEEVCEWTMDVKQALDVKLLVRKIDPKRKLGGVIEIQAAEGEFIIVSLPSKKKTSSNASSDSARTIKTRTVCIDDSEEARSQIDVIIPDLSPDTGNDGKSTQSKCGSSSSRHVLPSNSLEPALSVTGGHFKVRFTRSPETITSIKSHLEHQHQRTRSRKKFGSELSRYVIEYEATLPDGVEHNDDESDYVTRNGVSERESRRKHKQRDHRDPGSRPKQHPGGSMSTKEAQRGLGKTRFVMSKDDAIALIEAISTVENVESGENEGPNAPIKIEVIVEPVAGEGAEDVQGGNNRQMSEFTIPLLLAVLLTTTVILILSAILVIFRRGGITGKKREKSRNIGTGLVVNCHPQDGDRGMKKASSDSNLSSSSTADSLLLTDSDASKYSPQLSRDNSPPVSPSTIQSLMEILKGHPGILSRPPLESDPYKQIHPNPSQMTFGPDHIHSDFHSCDVTGYPASCSYCCGYSEDTRAHKHGDTCRSHHGKNRLQNCSASRSSGKNPRGLAMKGCLKPNSGHPQPGLSLAPPLSPIREVSSVTSSMISLPITTSNSQTSLLSRSKNNPPYKSAKKGGYVGDMGSETEAFLTQDSDAESGVGDFRSQGAGPKAPLMDRVTKLRFSDNVREKIVPGRYLGGTGAACYDSGYATSNYDEEDEEKSGSKKENKNYLSLSSMEKKSSNGIPDPEVNLITP